MSLLLQVTGIDLQLLKVSKSSKNETRTFSLMGFFLILSFGIAAVGGGYLSFILSDNFLISVLGALFWGFLFLNLYRLMIIISTNNLHLTFGLFINRSYKMIIIFLLATIGIGGVTVGISGLFTSGPLVPTYSSIMEATSVFNDPGPTLVFIVLILYTINILPFGILLISKDLRMGAYFEALIKHEKEQIRGNYITFKADYKKVLSELINSRGQNLNERTSNSLEFYEAYVDPPYNTAYKKDW